MRTAVASDVADDLTVEIASIALQAVDFSDGLAQPDHVVGAEPGLGRVVGTLRIPCGACERCVRGLSQHCPSARLARTSADGRLRSVVDLPRRALMVIPEGVDDDSALVAPLVARAVHAAQRIRVEGKTYVTILGDTAQALIAAQMMARLNASVRVIGDRPGRFTLCEKWGVKHRHADDIGRRQDQDIVFVTDDQWASLALRLVRPRGRVVLFAGAVGGDSLDPSEVTRLEIDLAGVATGPIDDALAWLARGEIDTHGLISRRLRGGEIESARQFATEPDALIVQLTP